MALNHKNSYYFSKIIVETYIAMTTCMQYYGNIRIVVPMYEYENEERDKCEHCDIRCKYIDKNEIFDIDVKTIKNENTSIDESQNYISLSCAERQYLKNILPDNHYIAYFPLPNNNSYKMTGDHIYLSKTIDLLSYYEPRGDKWGLIPVVKMNSSNVEYKVLFNGSTETKWTKFFHCEFENEETHEIVKKYYDFTPKQYKFIINYVFEYCNGLAYSDIDTKTYINKCIEKIKEACEHFHFNESVYKSILQFSKDVQYWR